ncbi:MAG TPA: hypothetical protein ENG87_01825 [Candidatus Pacearchaeota archaeon]|nr:hypothetical protein BMS3Abin17_00115 [archaeon BMS3Abin17]HDK42091.1 hypothetical protein [Candidatus Pacearchaeota archaeon]HDZ60143.1 hypothetical protein [Candidatus Pacearchaeota archaeon]
MLKHSREISRKGWKGMVWTPIVLGVIMFSIFTSTFYIPRDYLRATWFSAIGFLLVGWGFGLAYSRVWRIKEIDD